MSDPDRELRERRERSIGTMSMIAFILAALAALISIIYVRPLPIADDPPPKSPARSDKELLMHKIAIPQSVVDRVIARRGREHIHDDLDPARTALVVVDMQNAFMMPGVAHSLCLEAQEIVPNINRLARSGARDRRRGGLDPDRLHRRDQEELVGLLRHQQARAERQARRGARTRQQGLSAVGRRSTPRRTTSTSRRTASPPSSRARRTSPRCCVRKASTPSWSPARSQVCAASRPRATP